MAVGGIAILARGLQVRPAGLEGETDKFTVPLNPLSGMTLIVEVPEEPALIAEGVTMPVEITKSICGVKVTMTV